MAVAISAVSNDFAGKEPACSERGEQTNRKRGQLIAGGGGRDSCLPSAPAHLAGCIYLKIPVRNSQLVAVADGIHQRLDDFARLLLAEVVLFDNPVK